MDQGRWEVLAEPGDCCVSVSEGKERDLGITDGKPKSVFGSLKGEF